MSDPLPAFSSPWASAQDRAAEREQKREAVIRAAAHAFAENGYYRTSLTDIADMLGVTKPTIYYYAKSKEDLLFAVYERAQETMAADVPHDPHAPAVERLRAYMRIYAHSATTPYGRCFVAMVPGDISVANAAYVRDAKKVAHERLKGFIKAAADDGSVAPCNVNQMAMMISGALNGIATWYRPDGPLKADTIVEIYINQLMMGLLPRKPA